MLTTGLYQLSKAGTVNVVDLTLPHTLDIQEFDRLNEAILSLVHGEPEGQWVLDLSRLSYMGSAALGLMVNLRQQIKQSGGRLVLCGLSPQLLQIFKTCCMERLFKIVKTREDAVAAAAW
jgi:anti-anti-sigma factor